MGKKKSRGKQRNLNKQPQQEVRQNNARTESSIGTSPITKDTSTSIIHELAGDKTVNPPQAEIKDTNLTTAGREQECTVRDSALVRGSEYSIPSTETISSNNSSEKNVISNSENFSDPSFETSSSTNNSPNCNCNKLPEDNAIGLPQTTNRDSNAKTHDSECESIVRNSALETEKECLIPSNENISRENSLVESILSEPSKFSESLIRTSSAMSSSEMYDSNELDREKINDLIQTTTTESNLTSVEREGNSNIRDSSLETENECLIPSNEMSLTQSSSVESTISKPNRFSESSFGTMVATNELECSNSNKLDEKDITNIIPVPKGGSNSYNLECEQEIIGRYFTLETKICLVPTNEAMRMKNLLEEPHMFADSQKKPRERDIPISAQATENPTFQTHLPSGEEVPSHENSKEKAISKTNSADDKASHKHDVKKCNRKNKRISNKNKTALGKSLVNNDKPSLPLDFPECSQVIDNELNLINTDTKEIDTGQHISLQPNFENSTGCKDQSEKIESTVVGGSILASVKKASNGNEAITNFEGVKTEDDAHFPCEDISSIQIRKEEKEINIFTGTSPTQVNLEDNKNKISMATENCHEFINSKTTESASCLENKQKENIPVDSLILDNLAKSLTDAAKYSKNDPLSENQHVEHKGNFNNSADILPSSKNIGDHFPSEEPISTKKPDQVELFTCTDESKSEELHDINISLLTNSDISKETTYAAEIQPKKEIEQNIEKLPAQSSAAGFRKPKLKEDPLLASQIKTKKSLGKNSGPKNGAKIEKPSMKIHANPEKTNSDSKKMNLATNECMLDSFVNSNLDTILSKNKRHTFKQQTKEDKRNPQCNIKTEDNVSLETDAAGENKILMNDAVYKQESEIKQSKHKNKSVNNHNTKKSEGNDETIGINNVGSNVEKIKEASSENRSDNQTKNQPLLTDLMEGSSLLNAEKIFPARPIFMANTCHVCKSTHGGATRLKSCSACRLIAYCSKDHQRKHWKEHKSVCQVVQNMIKQSGLTNLLDNAYKITDPEEWRKYRCYQLVEIEKYLGRALLPYEREMFLYPRVCSICHKSDQEKLKACKVCHYVNYCCNEHIPNTHNVWCKELKLLLEINQYQSRNGLIKPCIPHFNLDRTKPFPKDMKDFIFFSTSTEENTSSFRLYEAALSDVASYPLTVLYVLEYLKQENFKNFTSYDKLTIHLVGAENQFEVDTLSKWDAFLLNLLPQLSQLHLVFIGPELMPNDISEMKRSNYKKRNCKTIDPSKKFVTEFYYATLYHEYVKEKTFSKPDMICAFNCGIYRFTGFDNKDTWGPTLLTMVKDKDTPVVLTAYTEVEAPMDVERFKKECRVKVLKPPTKNPFASIKPNLNFVSDDEIPLIYKNQYLSIIIKGKDEPQN